MSTNTGKIACQIIDFFQDEKQEDKLSPNDALKELAIVVGAIITTASDNEKQANEASAQFIELLARYIASSYCTDCDEGLQGTKGIG